MNLLKLCLLPALLLVAGCGSTSLEAARHSGDPVLAAAEADVDRDYCRQLDNAQTAWTAVGAGLGVVAASAGGGMIPDSNHPDPDIQDRQNDRRRMALGITAVVAGGGAAVSSYVAARKAQRWAAECQ